MGSLYLFGSPHIYGRFGDGGSLKLRGPQNFMTPSCSIIFTYKKLTPPTIASSITNISLYITEQRYPPDCSQDKKRAIGEKAAMFNVRKGVLFIKKKNKSVVRPDFS